MPDPGPPARRQRAGPSDPVAPLSAAPLAGLRVIVTRPAERGQGLVNRLTEMGAVAFAVPAISFQETENPQALDTALSALERFDWTAFTSATAVEFCVKRLSALGASPQLFRRTRIAAVGPATLDALRQHGLQVEVVAEVHSGQGLVDSLATMARGQRVLLPRADIADPGLVRSLRAAGIAVHEVVAYRTVAPPDLPERAAVALAGGTDLICFSSPSGVRHFLNSLGATVREGWNRCAATVGPTTTRAAREAGLDVVVEAAEGSMPGLVDGILRWWSRRQPTDSASAPYPNPTIDRRILSQPR